MEKFLADKWLIWIRIDYLWPYFYKWTHKEMRYFIMGLNKARSKSIAPMKNAKLAAQLPWNSNKH